jgi:hypothetical protein
MIFYKFYYINFFTLIQKLQQIAASYHFLKDMICLPEYNIIIIKILNNFYIQHQ